MAPPSKITSKSCFLRIQAKTERNRAGDSRADLKITFLKNFNPILQLQLQATVVNTSSPYLPELKPCQGKHTPLRDSPKLKVHCLSNYQVHLHKGRADPQQNQQILLLQHFFLSSHLFYA